MDFEKYQHVEKFGTTEVEGIDIGTCYIFPKIDGTNGTIWYETDNRGVGQVCAGSRTRRLSYPDVDNQGFYKWIVESGEGEKCANLLRDRPAMRLYGEFLVPHTLRTYDDKAWGKFYVFDVMDYDAYLPYEDYSLLLDAHDIEYIPPIAIIKNPTYEKLIGFLDRNTYLIKDGQGVGEGIVIKNYDYRNKYGRQTWAKIVSNEFKASHAKVQPTEVQERRLVEEDIVNKYVTLSLVEKEYAKIAIDGWESKMIPRLLGTVYYCLVKEECWNFVKEFKNPSIDFKRLMYFTNNRVKQLLPNLF